MKIMKIDEGSPASRSRLSPGDEIISVNGHPIADVLDLRYYSYDPRLKLRVRRPDGKEKTVRIRKDEGEPLGVQFEEFLMDKPRRCANNCVFCFIDQMPPGMRETLYFKDDDLRMSFLLGNYITLTNLTPRDIDRICDMRISPVNVSVHATDPELREILASMRVHNAHTIYGRLIAEVEALGAKVLPSSLFLGAHIPKPGLLTKRALTAEEEADLAYGSKLALAVCDLDVGQTVVVKDGVALAVEGFDGTNATIRRGGRIARRGAMVVKVAKHGHDMRFDIPAVGLKTLKVMRKARCASLAVQAGRTLFVDLPAVVAEADRRGIAIVAFDSGLPPAPAL